MLDTLESEMESLDILSISIANATMEDVFIKYIYDENKLQLLNVFLNSSDPDQHVVNSGRDTSDEYINDEDLSKICKFFAQLLANIYLIANSNVFHVSEIQTLRFAVRRNHLQESVVHQTTLDYINICGYNSSFSSFPGVYAN